MSRPAPGSAWPRCHGCGGPARPLRPASFTVLVNVQTVSEANRRDRWGRAKRSAEQREETVAAVSVALGAGQKLPEKGPWYVRFTRVDTRQLDVGNLPSSVKAIEDAMAACLGIDDGSPLYQGAYEQETKARNVVAHVRVEVWGGA